MSAEETVKALKFLSRLNIIHYYPKVLENVVFTNPQVILGILTKLTKKVYKIFCFSARRAIIRSLQRAEEGYSDDERNKRHIKKTSLC